MSEAKKKAAESKPGVPEAIGKRVAELRKLIAKHTDESDRDASKRITIVMDAFVTEVCRKQKARCRPLVMMITPPSPTVLLLLLLVCCCWCV